MSNPDDTNVRLMSEEGWAGPDGARWLSNLDRLESMLAPVGDALFVRAGFRTGDRVVDIGCGGGWTTRRIAELVGPDGSAVGLDISADLVDAANERARNARLANVRFMQGDAATAMPADAPFDHIFSRFGCMFFTDPAAAFANLRRMVRNGGRLDVAVWAPARDNPWMAETVAVVGRHIELPAPVPRAPGPFALDDPDYVRDLLRSAGFQAISIDAWTGKQQIGGAGSAPESAACFVLDSMHIGDLVRTYGSDLRAVIESDLIETYRAHAGPDGVRMGAKSWFVSAGN